MRHSIDTLAMQKAMDGFTASLAPHLNTDGARGAQARILTTVLPVYFQAMAHEMDAGTEGEAVYVAIVALLTHMAGSSVKTLEIEGTPEIDRLGRLLGDVYRNAGERLIQGDFARVPFEPTGSA